MKFTFVVEGRKLKMLLSDKRVFGIKGKIKRLYYIPPNGSYAIEPIGDRDKRIILFHGDNIEVIMERKDLVVFVGEVHTFDVYTDKGRREITNEVCGNLFRLSAKDYERIYNEDPDYSPCD